MRSRANLVLVRLVFRPTPDELTGATWEQLRLRGLASRVRAMGLLLVVAGLLGVFLDQWLFTLYAVAMGLAVLVAATRSTMGRAARKSPLLHVDTTMEVEEDGVTVTIPTATSRIDWAYYSGWSLVPEGLLLLHSMSPRLFSFVPRSALTPEVLDVVARHVPRHPKARDVRAGRRAPAP